MRGLFELETAADLYEKLKNDFLIFEKDKLDSAAAYNFFVTAWHMLEWVYPDDPAKQKAFRDSSIVLQICEHLAVGAKHFQPTNKKHESVKNSELTGGAWGKGFWKKGLWARGVWGEKMLIYLEGNAAIEYGDSIQAFELAKEAMEFWRKNEKDIT